MSKTAALMEKLRQQNEEIATLDQYWQSLFPDFDPPSAITTRAWLQRYDFDTVVAGLDAALVQASKRLEGKPMTPEQVINYASATMRDIKLNSMPPDERHAHISKVRAIAGKKGADSRWNGKKDLPPVSQDLPSVATGLLPAYAGAGSGSGSPAVACATAHADADGKPVPTLAPLAVQHSAVNQNLKANQQPKTNPSTPSLQQTRKPKQAPDGTAYPPEFNSWSNAERLDWLAEHGLPVDAARLYDSPSDARRQEIIDELDEAGREPDPVEDEVTEIFRDNNNFVAANLTAQQYRDLKAALCSTHGKALGTTGGEAKGVREVLKAAAECAECKQTLAAEKAAAKI